MKISRGFSVYLDLLRGLAATIVLLSHFAYARYTEGKYIIIRELNLGSDAVILFFVISGFVIAYTVEQKDAKAGRYFFQRATRLYSVAIPAIIFTFIFDTMGSNLAPEVYDGWWYNPSSIFSNLFYGLSFSSEWGGNGFRMGTNGPYWSLSYEVAYYILFGVFAFLTGVRRILLMIFCVVVFGIKALILMPSWLFGVMVYRLLKAKIEINRNLLYLMATLPFGIYALMLYGSLPETLMSLSVSTFGQNFIYGLRFSDEFLWNGIIGMLFAVQILAMGLLLKDVEWKNSYSKSIRWYAGASFSIYVIHYSLLLLIDAFLADIEPSLMRDIILLTTTLATALIFAQLFERPLPLFRKKLQKILKPKAV